MLSCLVLALECEGRAIETVEGLARGAELHPLQAAFADLGAAQCGYCTPGILMTAKALLEQRARRRAASGSRRRSSGNLCRCTGYQQIFEAIEEAASAAREGDDERRSASTVIGKPRRRVDGRAKVTGQTRFADDIVLPRMLHMRAAALAAPARA